MFSAPGHYRYSNPTLMSSRAFGFADPIFPADFSTKSQVENAEPCYQTPAARPKGPAGSWVREMAQRLPCAPARAAGHVIAAVLLVAVSASGAAAQTLTDPAPPAKWSSPAKAPTSNATANAKEFAKACSTFGPGFVNVPGTDACVKIGGWVTVEGSARR